jgi:hypothetical protein
MAARLVQVLHDRLRRTEETMLLLVQAVQRQQQQQQQRDRSAAAADLLLKYRRVASNLASLTGSDYIGMKRKRVET